ncbi:MAG: host-nuclease inhibitor Gam family protein [Candidatus Cloacimonetes bacterium]|nr:host-nuclease inhibitor Gam family protein [Candidatus Cloacimonadota bacterium]
MLQVERKQEERKSEGFVIDNKGKANWALRKIRQLKKKQVENDNLADNEISKLKSEIDEVKDWLKSENDNLQNSIDFFENLLKGYAFSIKEEDPEFKTLKLPFGELQFRKRRDKWNYDEEKLLEFAKDNIKTSVKVVEKVDKRKLKKLVKKVDDKVIIEATGEIVEGISIEKRDEEFKVKIES